MDFIDKGYEFNITKMDLCILYTRIAYSNHLLNEFFAINKKLFYSESLEERLVINEDSKENDREFEKLVQDYKCSIEMKNYTSFMQDSWVRLKYNGFFWEGVRTSEDFHLRFFEDLILSIVAWTKKV